jgi:hypothetical protein
MGMPNLARGAEDLIAFLRQWRIEHPEPDDQFADEESRKAVQRPHDLIGFCDAPEVYSPSSFKNHHASPRNPAPKPASTAQDFATTSRLGASELINNCR